MEAMCPLSVGGPRPRAVREECRVVIEPTTEQGRKLAALSQQLRVLHTELSDQSADLRREQLRDEVQRATSALPPQDREGFLKSLKERFPVWSGEEHERDQFAQAGSVPQFDESRAQFVVEMADVVQESRRERRVSVRTPEVGEGDEAGEITQNLARHL